ncbi:hypothetical protein VR44_31115 [Streptomyces katrae]|uniref:Uncharacterized protein n=1 Tax=Streptomyces katrae TaxID=68223 RepID=A0A0F4IZ84_9ACTN|nr:hypothetical protein VR44_31115 [Streptomyces katrae]
MTTTGDLVAELDDVRRILDRRPGDLRHVNQPFDATGYLDEGPEGNQLGDGSRQPLPRLRGIGEHLEQVGLWVAFKDSRASQSQVSHWRNSHRRRCPTWTMAVPVSQRCRDRPA